MEVWRFEEGAGGGARASSRAAAPRGGGRGPRGGTQRGRRRAAMNGRRQRAGRCGPSALRGPITHCLLPGRGAPPAPAAQLGPPPPRGSEVGGRPVCTPADVPSGALARSQARVPGRGLPLSASPGAGASNPAESANKCCGREGAAPRADAHGQHAGPRACLRGARVGAVPPEGTRSGTVRRTPFSTSCKCSHTLRPNKTFSLL